MKRFTFAALMLALTLVASATSFAGDDPGRNAALTYWRAFAMMPTLSSEEEQIAFSDKPLPASDEKTAAIAAKWEGSLGLLRQAAAVSDCAWGVDYEAEGMSAVLPHLASARRLARGACFSARWLAARGDYAGAARNLEAVVRLARHVGRGGEENMISSLVACAVEQRAVETFAGLLVDSASASALLEAIDRAAKSQPEHFAKKTLLADRDNFFRAGAQELRQRAADGTLAEYTESNVARSAGLSGYPNPDALFKALDETEGHITTAAEIVDLPDWEFQKRWESFEADVKKSGNRTSMEILQSLVKMRHYETRSCAYWALLQAAVAYLRSGREAFESVKDPFGDDGPFAMSTIPGGFELKSLFWFDGKNVALRFGPAQ